MSFPKMHQLFLILIAIGVQSVSLSQQNERRSPDLVIDGILDDPFWKTVAKETLTPNESGVPAAMGGAVYAGVRDGYLCLAAQLPEPEGKVQARSFGLNPVWEIDATGSPPLEDRVQFHIEYTSESGEAQHVVIAVNPWGACRIEKQGAAIHVDGLLPAARVASEGSTAEIALPLAALGTSRGESITARFRATRIRARRPLSPEFAWSWPGVSGFSKLTLPAIAGASATPPDFRPPLLGNAEAPLEVGRVSRLPPIVAEWDHPAWRDVPSFELPRNEPFPRAPRHPTRVKWMHDGHSLAVLFHLTEPEPVVARAGGRDNAVTSDDHVALYLATSGSAFLEIAINPVGTIRDSRGRGPRSMSPQPGWNADVEVQTDIRHGAWIARMNIPLEQCAVALGETAIPRDWRVLVARTRAARPGEAAETSALPPVGTVTFHGPIRYRRMMLGHLVPAEVRMHRSAQPEPQRGLAGELAELESNVWSPLHRRHHQVRSMVQRQQLRRAEAAVWSERQAWNKVNRARIGSAFAIRGYRR